MDYLQYKKRLNLRENLMMSFKPYYKWITFNIINEDNAKAIDKGF